MEKAMAKPRIVVFRMRELIYTAIFAVLAIILLILVFFMFRPKETKNRTKETSHAVSDASEETYFAGVYTTSLTLSNQAVDLEVTVDKNHINNIRLVNLGESVTTMFPLVEPALDELSRQICQKQSTDGITCSQENKYTSHILFQAIQNALAKARK